MCFGSRDPQAFGPSSHRAPVFPRQVLENTIRGLARPAGVMTTSTVETARAAWDWLKSERVAQHTLVAYEHDSSRRSWVS